MVVLLYFLFQFNCKVFPGQNFNSSICYNKANGIIGYLNSGANVTVAPGSDIENNAVISNNHKPNGTLTLIVVRNIAVNIPLSGTFEQLYRVSIVDSKHSADGANSVSIEVTLFRGTADFGSFNTEIVRTNSGSSIEIANNTFGAGTYPYLNFPKTSFKAGLKYYENKKYFKFSWCAGNRGNHKEAYNVV